MITNRSSYIYKIQRGNIMKELISSLLLWLSIAALCWLFAVVTPPQSSAENDWIADMEGGR